MKRILTLVATLLLALGASSCHKTCTCITYNNIQHTYTTDQLDSLGVSCADMRYRAGVQYYPVCSWD